MFHVEPDFFMPRNNLAATPQGAVGRQFMAILSEEWRGVINRICNYKIPLAFAHVILTKALGVCRAREIRQRITMRMCLYKRGLHVHLVGDAEAEGAAREDRAFRVGEEDNEALGRTFHSTVLSGKLMQAV